MLKKKKINICELTDHIASRITKNKTKIFSREAKFKEKERKRPFVKFRQLATLSDAMIGLRSLGDFRSLVRMQPVVTRFNLQVQSELSRRVVKLS